MTEEIELKLALSARLAGRVVGHPAVKRAAIAVPQTGHLVSVYYDTPKFELRAAGIGLRVRRSPAGWIQTLKWGGSAIGGLHRRGEVETQVPSQQVNLAAITHPELVSILAPARIRKHLKPVFVTEFDRTGCVLQMGAARVELSVDRGHILAGSAREALCEVELELLSGEPTALFDLCSALRTEFPLHPLSRSKAERGYALAGDKQTPEKSRALVLNPQMSVAQSAARILASGLEQLQTNEHGMRSGADSEYLHQMRVAVRRLRAVLSAYSGALPAEPFDFLRGELKWLGARLGIARDWDVYVTELLPPLQGELAGNSAVDALAQAAQRRRDQANRSARAAVHSRRYAGLILGLARVVATPDWQQANPECASAVVPFASHLLERRYEKVAKRRARLDKYSVRDLHALRIGVKKLRYCAENFASLFALERAKQFRARLTALQESLGRINDAAGMQRLTDSVLPRSTRQLTTVIAGWNARLVYEERVRLIGLWREFRRIRKFW